MNYARHTLVRDFLAAFQESTHAAVADAQTEVEGLAGRAIAQLPGRVQPLELAFAALNTAYPRDIRSVVDRLHAHSSGGGQADIAPVVLGEYLSVGARQALRAAGVNYYDRSGTLYFRHETWLCDIQRESRKAPARSAVSLFSGTREQVVHALLMAWRQSQGRAWLTGTEVAQQAQTSTATVSVVMQELERLEWVEVMGSGPRQRRRLRDAAALLDAWAQVWTQRLRNETRSRWFAYAQRLEDLERKLASVLEPYEGWAVTGAAPANRIAPLLTVVDRTAVIVPRSATSEWAELLQLKPAERGFNVTLVEREGASVQFTTCDSGTGARLASPFVQYLDLLDGAGRNKELAAEFRRQVLGLPDVVALHL